MDLQLQNQHAVIVGGARGLGLAIGKAFAAEGAKVSLIDLLPEVADVAKPLGGTGCSADVADEKAMMKAAETIVAGSGPVEHVVFAAAIGSGHFGFPFWNVPPDVWFKVLAINLVGAVHTAHAFGKRMAEAKRGTLLFISSVAGQIGSQTDPPYSASKAGVINFAQCIAKDLAPYGVRANTLCPGMIQTTLNKGVWQSWADRQSPDTWLSYEDWTASKIKQVVPLNRWQTPEDIAAMAVFLASERGRNITGQTINVDGGFVMHW